MRMKDAAAGPQSVAFLALLCRTRGRMRIQARFSCVGAMSFLARLRGRTAASFLYEIRASMQSPNFAGVSRMYS